MVAPMPPSKKQSKNQANGEPASPLGKRLRQERDGLGLSLRELARRLDVSPSLVSQIETGKVQPSVRTLYAMVSELGVSLDDVFPPDAGGRSDVGARLSARRPIVAGTSDGGEGYVQRAND